MKRAILTLVAAASLAGAAAPAFAQGFRPNDWRPNDARQNDWQPLSQRQFQIERRIDDGVRSGQLTRFEARDLRNQFNDLLRLEARYERHGLTFDERADLQRRYDVLAMRVRFERRDDQTRYHPAGRYDGRY